jgi:type II secretory pathway pseudopilin PulG
MRETTRSTAAAPAARKGVRRPHRGARVASRREAGVLLVALMVAMTVMMILLTASAQSWTAVMKREREEELIFRGNQYINALKLYAGDHGGTFPTELKALMEKGPKGSRYLRQQFGDPFDPDGKWNLIYLGPDGKSAFNPNARPPEGLLPGQDGLGGSTRGKRGSSVLGVRGGSRSGRERGFGGEDPGTPGGPAGMPGGASAATMGARPSGFSSGNMNTPIVGVVSRSGDLAFREYLSKKYYNEWEFHVFMKDIPNVKSGPIPGLNINPQGYTGAPGGPQLIPAGGQDPNDKGQTPFPGGGGPRVGRPVTTPRGGPQPGGGN